MAASDVMRLLLRLPAFLLAVFIMSWSLPLANLCFYIKAWKLVGRRGDVYQWCGSTGSLLIHAVPAPAAAACRQFADHRLFAGVISW
jgi:hypothetical protein